MGNKTPEEERRKEERCFRVVPLKFTRTHVPTTTYRTSCVLSLWLDHRAGSWEASGWSLSAARSLHVLQASAVLVQHVHVHVMLLVTTAGCRVVLCMCVSNNIIIIIIL